MNNAFTNPQMYQPMQSVYNPYPNSYQQAQMYNNAQAYQQQAQPTVQGSSITFVNGLEGAKGYMLPPNNTVILMDSDNSKFYIKSTDAVGMATIKGYRFEEEVDKIPTKEDELYVRKEDINTYIDNYLHLVKGSGNNGESN